MKKITISISFLFFVFLANTALAHQPRLPESANIDVKNPEISQAFYTELKGEPNVYKITSDKTFILYANLLVPDITNARKDFIMEIYKETENTAREQIYFADGAEFKWEEFFEEFGGDNYFWGPEYKQEQLAGTYYVKIYNPDNQGKYVVAIGEKEEFPFSETINAVVLLPQIKIFFGKSILTAYFNKSGLFLGIFLVVLGLLCFIIIKITKFLKRKFKGQEGE